MTASRLFWHLALAPALGGAAGAWLYTTFARPVLPLPQSLLDVGAVLAGSIGVLAGGIASFGVAPAAQDDAARRRSGWMPFGAGGVTGVAVSLALLLAGVLGPAWPAVAAGVAAGCVAAIRLRAR